MTSCQFVKFMDQNFSQILTFPANLMMDFEKLAEVITLEGPSGNRWLVRLSNIGGHAYLKEGWKEFVEVHHVEEGDCLVFEYCGSSCFSVLIFDRSGCEREASYFVGIMNPILKEGCHAEEKDESQPADVLKFSSPIFPCDDNSPLQGISDREKSSSFKEKFDRRKLTTRSSALNDKINYEHTIQPKEVEEHSSKQGSINMQEGQTTGIKLKAKVRYLRSTKAIRAETPYFTKFLLPSHLNATNLFMTFPYDFAVKHLHLRPQNIFLRHEEKMWSVLYTFKGANQDSLTGLSGKGWHRFVRDNELHEGDGCIFVLLESDREKVLDVHIVRVVEKLDMI